MRRFLFPILTLLIVGALWWSNRPAAVREAAPVRVRPPADARRDVARAPDSLPPEPPQLRAAPPFDPAAYPLAAKLNAPNSSVHGDLEALRDILEAWRTNFPRDGHPVGENGEIATALSGANALQLVLIPRTHPAFNARGELCDRWGTPYRFHALSGQKMELASAGPDRKFGTADDAAWPPP